MNDFKETVQYMKVYSKFESAAKDFLFISSYPMKDKTHKVKSAKALLDAIEEYKKLPLELRTELENDKSSNASQINQFEKLCREAIKSS
jgi:uncharacterized protein Yka (UPF0111/DUF47 family)